MGELERMKIPQEEMGPMAARTENVILLKGQIDYIAGPDGSITEVAGGNAGLTVGGTGDALAGLTAGLIAQKMEPVEAAIRASKIIKAAGDRLLEEKGCTYTTRDVIEQIPYLLHEMNKDD